MLADHSFPCPQIFMAPAAAASSQGRTCTTHGGLQRLQLLLELPLMHAPPGEELPAVLERLLREGGAVGGEEARHPLRERHVADDRLQRGVRRRDMATRQQRACVALREDPAAQLVDAAVRHLCGHVTHGGHASVHGVRRTLTQARVAR